jgi:type II secretory pathway predicted ATPase ExeA
MYKAYFKLTHNPFDLTPDPLCFVPTERHNEALAALYHGVRHHKGFVVVTGEVGTGKTLLLRCLLGLLKESKDVAYAYMFNGRLSPTEFLQYIVSDFGLPAAGKSKYELLLDFGRFLVERGAKKMTTLLIVDEAHLLSPEILEEVRLLSNLETTDDKLLQIVLVGQPELDEMLDSVELRQIKQRISVRTQLIPLNGEETKLYIERRLQIAGANQDASPMFSTEAISEVFHYSKGLPRLINTICENALIAAYAKRQPSVTPEIVENVAKELRLDIVHTPAPLKASGSSEIDIHRTMAALVDLYEAIIKSNGAKASAGVPAEMEVSKHEPYI